MLKLRAMQVVAMVHLNLMNPETLNPKQEINPKP